MVNCPQCGRENADGSKFCVHCGSAIAQAAPEPTVPAPPQPAYQEPYRAPFTGNLHDHPPFVVVFVVAAVCALGMALPRNMMGSALEVFDNNVVRFLFHVVFLAGGIAGLAGCIGLWRLREWGRMSVVASQGALALAGVMTLIGGGRAGGGSETAAVILSGILMLVIAAAVIFYLFTDDVRSRMLR